MKSSAVTVAETATLIIGADDLNRYVYVHNGGGAKIYIGDESVTTTSGFHLANNESLELFVPSRQTLYGVVASGTNVINVLTPDAD
jgi:hypothetical protein